ncbi:hypothetical protein LZ30DRAFT_779398 [Colletotrichum cereale]|nr:hypothetical protein LZ30DRAFT_779398 [Colletotrichum cereale]
MSSFRVVIVGGGLSGSLLANGLLSNGVDFTLYERDAAGSRREGYQIRLGDAATEGFGSCLRRDRIAAIRKKLGQSTDQSSTAPLVCDSRFRVILDLSQLPTYSKSAAINRVVLRDLLLGPASFFWGLNVAKKMYPDHEVKEGGDHLRFCLETIQHWAPEYHTMLSIGEHKDVSPVTATNIRASRPLSKTWRRKLQSRGSDEGHPRVWLMGDAVHAMQPNIGMGGNQALRDCADLGRVRVKDD